MPIIRAALTACLLLASSACMQQQVKPDSAPANVAILDNSALNIDRIKPQTVKVVANKPWQNSGIFIENGHLVHVSASGKWSAWPEMNIWSGPEGTTMWSRRNMTGGALIAKLGHDGRPFEVGVTRTFRAQDYGMLYFMNNDLEKDLFNNTGEVEAEVYIGGSKQQAASNASDVKVVAYNYDDMSRKGSLSASSKDDQFGLRNWMLNKIGEISSSKNVAIKAGREPVKGGTYVVLDEAIVDGVLTIDFKAIY